MLSMAATPPEYKRSFEDELDWNLLEQLDRVVLQISGFSFRTKQLCLAIDIAVVGLLINFTDNELDQSIFVAGFVIPLSFWVLDSISYYYQVKPRGVMDNIRDRLRERNSEQLIHGAQINVIDRSRTERNSFLRVLGAFFNHSMWLYLLLASADLILWYMFSKDFIG